MVKKKLYSLVPRPPPVFFGLMKSLFFIPAGDKAGDKAGDEAI